MCPGDAFPRKFCPTGRKFLKKKCLAGQELLSHPRKMCPRHRVARNVSQVTILRTNIQFEESETLLKSRTGSQKSCFLKSKILLNQIYPYINCSQRSASLILHRGSSLVVNYNQINFGDFYKNFQLPNFISQLYFLLIHYVVAILQ